MRWGIGVLTGTFAFISDMNYVVSDRVSNGESSDLSGPVVQDMARHHFGEKLAFIEHAVVPDNETDIKNRVLEWTDRPENPPALILTIGGTGFAKRDVTPEALTPIFHKNAANIVQAALWHSLSITKFAALSRATSGIRQSTLIITLPGSPKACREILEFLLPLLNHALELIAASDDTTMIVHPTEASSCRCNQPDNYIERSRVSPYPMVPLEDARRIIMDQITPLSSTSIPLTMAAIGQILAEDLHASMPSPSFRASVVDVPVRSGDIRTVVQTVNAGGAISWNELTVNQVVRISTGARLPPDAEAVVMVEETEIVEMDEANNEKSIRFLSDLHKRQFIREVGSDIEIGDLITRRGTLLSGVEVAALASVGVRNVSTYAKPTVAIISTGDELRSCFEKDVPEGCIRDANKVLLVSFLDKYGFERIDLGIVRDNDDELLAKLEEALERADVVITTGGVSMGNMDMMKPIMEDRIGATIHFGRVNMKPGKPCTFATVIRNGAKKYIFALPGNPVSAAVCFLIFCLPALRKLSGNIHHERTIMAKLGENLVADQDRPEFHRVKLSWQAECPHPIVSSTGKQHSSRLLSLTGVDGLVLVQPSQSLVKGELVSVILLSQ